MRLYVCFVFLLTISASCASSNAPGEDRSNVRVPIVIQRIEPQYPQQLRAERVEGVVVIGGIVPKEGGVLRNPRVVRSDDPRLNQYALHAVARWIWSPGYQDGEAVDVEFTTEVRFSLKNGR